MNEQERREAIREIVGQGVTVGSVTDRFVVLVDLLPHYWPTVFERLEDAGWQFVCARDRSMMFRKAR